MADEQTPAPHKAPRLHRRVLAYVAMFNLSMIACRAAFGPEIVSNNLMLLQALVTAFAGLVAWYVGAQVAPDLFPRKPQ